MILLDYSIEQCEKIQAQCVGDYDIVELTKLTQRGYSRKDNNNVFQIIFILKYFWILVHIPMYSKTVFTTVLTVLQYYKSSQI